MTDTCTPTASHAMDESTATALATTVKALSDPLRVRMLSAISSDPRGEACVCDLEPLADLSQPTISHHLKVMRDAGVLESERRGTWVYYRIVPALRAAVTTLLDSFAPALTASDDPQIHLADVDAQLTRIATELHDLYAGLDSGLVLHVVRESYAALARRATVSRLLIPVAEKFARQRLTDLSRDRTSDIPHVLFVCVANAGRSQLAAALVNQLSGGRVVARSAGSTPAGAVHPNVQTVLAQIWPEAAADAFPKPLTDDAVRAADVVITMGCGDVCPVIPGVRYEDWAVGDPALASVAGVEAIRDDLTTRVKNLLTTLGKGLS